MRPAPFLPVSAYSASGDRYDEMLERDAGPREHWAQVARTLDELGLEELLRRQGEATRLLHEDGVVYHQYGAGSQPWQPWQLDAVPTIVDGREWSAIEAAIAQRAELLSSVLDDLYGPRELLRRGVLPASVVFEHDGFLRACDGIRLPARHQLFTYAADLGRDADGRWVVLADKTQAPSGSGYALENRQVMSRVLPSLYRGASVHRLEPFFRQLRAALLEAAPPGIDDPRVVVLTPGPWNETAFEHALLSTRLGYPLVEPADLVVRADGVHMRSPGQLEPVHVILRRVDAGFCDPLELRPDSHLGVPGLVEATRRGSVSVVNSLGSGALENPALMRFLPDIARHVFGHELDLPCVPSWWCGNPDELGHVLANLDALVLRPISSAAGERSIFGALASRAELDALRDRVRAHPARWVAQDPLPLSSVPTLTADGLAARRSVLRAFAVARGDAFTVMPGGLTRAAPDDLPGPITNQSGAIAKDTWVIASEPEAAGGLALLGGPVADEFDPLAALPAGAAEHLWWLGRYAERAEATARLMRTILDRRSDFVGSGDEAGLIALSILRDGLAEVTGVERGASADPWDDLIALLVDDRIPGTLAQSVRALLEAAHAVRDQLSSDTWLVIGDLDRRLTHLHGRHDIRAPDAQGAVQQVLHGLLALSGLVAEGMVRDLAWRFLDGGRRAERALGVLALLRSTLPGLPREAGSLLLESVVTATENIITYRRRTRLHWHLETILELLVLDEDNPRSVASSLVQLAASLDAVPRSTVRRRADQRFVLEALTRLRTCDPAALARERSEELPRLLDELTRHVTKAAEGVERDHFLLRLPQRTLGGDPAR